MLSAGGWAAGQEPHGRTVQVIYQRHFWGERPIYFHCLACSVTSWLELWSFLHPQSLRCYVAASHPFPDVSLMRTLQALSLLSPCRAAHRALPCGILPGPVLQVLHGEHLTLAQLHDGTDPLAPDHVRRPDHSNICRESRGLLCLKKPKRFLGSGVG